MVTLEHEQRALIDKIKQKAIEKDDLNPKNASEFPPDETDEKELKKLEIARETSKASLYAAIRLAFTMSEQNSDFSEE